MYLVVRAVESEKLEAIVAKLCAGVVLARVVAARVNGN
jgi:hypothetical protein